MINALSQYFSAVAVKRLTEVEISPKKSNQHEFNGISDFRRILGTERITFDTTYVLITDEEERNTSFSGQVTWYDARENHPTRSEFRLYYTSNDVIKMAVIGDLVVIAKTAENKLAIIIAPKDSTSEKQLLWLFGIADIGQSFTIKNFNENKIDIGFAGRYILSSLGFEYQETAPDYLDLLLRNFGKTFPTTKIFADFSRATIRNVSPIEEPDKTLLIWLEREELLFKTLENAIVKERLERGFGNDGKDVDEFIKFSLSVQNRRKSRAGFSFENNLALIFSLNKINFSHGSITERNNKPDFIFPNIEQYHNTAFKTSLLTMLGVKTTAKDRWRQVLSEAARIKNKHLITLEPAISRNQTDEMAANNLQLVIPTSLMPTYSLEQQDSIIDLKEFIKIVTDNQNSK